MKVLVTGANGFIGSYAVEALKEKYEVIGFERNKSENIPFVQGDIRNKEDVLKATKGIDAVLHLAASVSSNNFLANYEINVKGAQNLVEACKKNKVRRVIFTSSFTTMLAEKDNYGTTKAQAEDVFKSSGLDVTILRLGMVYGKNGKGFTKMVKNVTAVPLFIPLIGNGAYRRQPVYVADVVDTIMKVLERKDTAGKTYYIAGEAVSYREMLRTIASELGVRKIMLPLPAFLWKGAGLLFENVLKNPPMSKRDITSMMAEAVFTDDSAKELGFKAIEFREGVERSL